MVEQQHLGFVLAAFVVALGSMGGYVAWLRARGARARTELVDARSTTTAIGPADRRATR